MYARIIKYFGLMIIVFFCATNIFLSLSGSEIIEVNDQHSLLMKMTNLSTFFENRFFDFRRSLTLKKISPSSKDKKIVLVAIDDITINKIGVWPLPRENYALLVDKLNHFGVKVVIFDVFFSEMSTACKNDSVASLPETQMANSFRKFQEAKDNSGKLKENKIILGYSIFNQPNSNTFKQMPDDLFEFMINSISQSESQLSPMFISKDVYPIKILIDSKINISHIVGEPDVDGVFRHYQLVANVDKDNIYMPSVALSAFEAFTNTKTKLITTPLYNELELANGNKMPIDLSGKTKIRWKGKENYYQKISFFEILNADINDLKMKNQLENSIVYIGSTAFGAHDLRQTPIGPITPGVYTHMAMTGMLLNNYFFKPINKTVQISWLLLIVSCILILGIQFFGMPILDLATMLTLTLGLFYYDIYYLIPQGYDSKLFFTLLAIISCYSWNTFLHFYLANKDKAFLKEAFGSYISPELIDEMYTSKKAPSLGGESGVRTAYFTDIQGFSSFSEKLSATDLVKLLNEYLSVMTDILLEEGGTLDKYEGDAIIAFFGAPMYFEDHAKRACTTAYRMQMALLDLRKKWESEGDKWPVVVHDMRMRIGINTGELVTGNMGSKTRMNYTMMGDTVNLAARLEEAAKQYGIFTQVSELTKKAAENYFIWRELDTIKVVGKSQPVTTFEILGLSRSDDKDLHDLSFKFSQAITFYKSQLWDKAAQLFKQTLEIEYRRYPKLKGVKTNPSEIYLKRCLEYSSNPPANDWDGVYTLTSK